jgi:DNA-binding response OmpR family regulator
MAEARKKVLCIEDDRETAKLIAEELSERGFYAVIAYDGRVGLAAILKRIPDLVLCDIGLPEMSGFEVLARLNELLPPLNRIPFVFLTGWSGRDNELKGRSLGADDYVTKPIDFDILEAIIRTRLIGGVARHEIAAKRPKLNDRHAEALPRGALGKTFPKRAAREQIVELFDAPTVDFDLDNAKPIRGTIAQAEAEANAAMGRVIKP